MTERTKFVRTVKAPETWRSGSLPNSTTRDVFKATPRDYDQLPAWDGLDRQVLRFYGCFKEAVVETNMENYRVRKCVLLYYLEDDTCLITEPRQDNSGIPQGTLVRRHRFPKPNSGYLRPEDLKVDSELTVYGKTIYLADADPFTRQYYTRIGLDQPEGKGMAEDPFTMTRTALHTMPLQQRTYEKLYREVQLGGGHINANMQQFMEHDRKVCRFFAVLDDLSTPQFERRPFTIHYFLSDDTVEMREQYPLNSGRDNFPVFFRRAKMPKDTARVAGPLEPPMRDSDFVKLSDFAVGKRINLSGRSYLVYDADDFTREYFDSVMGAGLLDKKDVRLPEGSHPRAATPPYTGYGSWDDSMSSVLHLIPKVPKKDFEKLYNNDGKILRFTCKFAHPKPEDMERRLVINFHLCDDSVSIHEPPQRNIGIITGKFLERGLHLNQFTGKVFEPKDLLPGEKVKIFNHEFVMLDMDEYTRKHAVEHKEDVNLDLPAVLEKFREALRQQNAHVRDIFRRFDADHDGVITFKEFKQALEKFGFMLSEPEALVLMKHFDKRQDGQITYNAFCDALVDEDYTTSMMKSKQVLAAEFDDAVYKHSGTMRKLVKEFGHMTHKDHVTCEQ